MTSIITTFLILSIANAGSFGKNDLELNQNAASSTKRRCLNRMSSVVKDFGQIDGLFIQESGLGFSYKAAPWFNGHTGSNKNQVNEYDFTPRGVQSFCSNGRHIDYPNGKDEIVITAHKMKVTNSRNRSSIIEIACLNCYRNHAREIRDFEKSVNDILNHL